jgi:Glu-tRNA(Gln) amidotransferase subunit E-like FAD-binding protein
MVEYKKIGFKSGLEIHQQLDTHKLFCDCPSVLRQDEPDLEIRRKLHAVAGESGEIDEAAVYESKKDREFVYQGYDTTCLVELDEEPPHEINEEALKIALHIAILLNAHIIPISQIMRKTVIDGSNTSGFQRTVMIGYDGFVETSKGNVRIASIYLEEDSARSVLKEEGKSVFRLDRLGIPLVEIATKTDIIDAEHAKETALKIGEILRACKVKRGIGTIRQDVNISVHHSNRVELKGFQDQRIMVRTVDNEILRQLEFVKNKKKNPSEVRNVLPDGTSEFSRPMPGSARMYPETDLPLLKISKQMIDEAKKTLPTLISDYEEELRKQGLNHEYIKMLLKQNMLELYRELVEIINNPNLVAKVLLIFPKDIATRKKKTLEDVERILEDNYSSVLHLVKKGKIDESNIKDVLEMLVEGKNLEDEIKIEKTDINEIEEKIHDLIKAKPGLNANAYMGLVMKEFRGKISGQEAMEIIKKFVKN